MTHDELVRKWAVALSIGLMHSVEMGICVDVSEMIVRALEMQRENTATLSQFPATRKKCPLITPEDLA